MSADPILSLPVDMNPPTENELQMVNMLFKDENKGVIKNVAKELREGFIISILFVLFSRSEVDHFIQAYLPVTRSSIVFLYMAKCFAITLLFYLLKNYAFSSGC